MSKMRLGAAVGKGWLFHLTHPRSSSSSFLAIHKSDCLGVLLTIATTYLLSVPTPVTAATYEWELLNGKVALKDPVILLGEGLSKTDSLMYTLVKPQLVGVGGGGAVFAFEDSKKLLKVSWEKSADSVERECSTLQLLERRKVESSERCLGAFKYYDNSRVMILMEPYVSDGVATVMEVDASKRSFAVEQIARYWVQMLAANVVTVDVQLLISKTSGQVTFIDMTEAQELKPPFDFLAKTLMSSFTSEMMTLIPDQFMSAAAKAATEEISKLETSGVVVSPEAMDVLHIQTGFFEA